MTAVQPLNTDYNFLADCINALTEAKRYQMPSDYAESKRFLSEATTAKPGKFSFEHTPYLREIIDCFHPESGIRQVALMKSAHVGGTVGVIENLLTYNIGERPCPQAYITATNEMAELRTRNNIEPAIESCGLKDLLFATGGNKKRGGDNLRKKEYVGGSLFISGGQTGNIGRSSSFRFVAIDEIDAINEIDKDGDFFSIIDNRVFKAFDDGQVFYISTPLLMQTSNIYKLFLKGDQRYYNVPCKHCGELIVLKWHIKPEDTSCNKKAGIVFDLSETEKLIPESVRYICQKCGDEIFEYDKKIMLPSGIWIPTEEPMRPEFRSYHINALYAPTYTWKDMAYKFLECYDVKRNRIKSIAKYKDFRQTDEGIPFEELGESIKYERVIRHRRMYQSGVVPNKLAIKDGAGKIKFLLCTVDVQKDHIFMDVKGVCKNGISYTIEFTQSSLGSTADINSPCWSELDHKICEQIYFSDDGEKYKVICTFVDAGHNTDTVQRFCGRYSNGVFPIFGRRSNAIHSDSSFQFAKKQKVETAPRFLINTDKMKDRLFAALRADWMEGENIPEYYPFFPEDFSDDYFKFFESEYKAEVKSKLTNAFMYFVYKPVYEGVPNHGLDTFAYFYACLDFVIERTCEIDLQIPKDLIAFWEYVDDGKFQGDV